jgi:hypothetical protein
MNSQEKLFPDHLTWGASIPVAPRAEPGITNHQNLLMGA